MTDRSNDSAFYNGWENLNDRFLLSLYIYKTNRFSIFPIMGSVVIFSDICNNSYAEYH